MPDDPYGDEQLVELYDADSEPRDDHAYYRSLADQVGATTIIDLGCGTGLLTRALATPGRQEIYTSVLYFRDAEELAADLAATGFEEIALSGGWHGEPLTAESRLIVVRAVGTARR